MSPFEAYSEIYEKWDYLSEEERFDLACIVAQCPYESYSYAKSIIGERFLIGELGISLDFFLASDYMTEFGGFIPYEGGLLGPVPQPHKIKGF